MTRAHIQPVPQHRANELRKRLDSQTKPVDSLGRLEELALQIGQIQDTLSPALRNPHILVFAGDHGLAGEGVSAYPSEVTRQMVLNFVAGGAAINVLCRQHQMRLTVVDAGVDGEFDASLPIRHLKIRRGTRNCLTGPAMTSDEYRQALNHGRNLVDEIARDGSNVIGFGEMGIGNTSSASLIFHALTGVPMEQCVGRGTGLDDGQLERKIAVLNDVVSHHSGMSRDPDTVVQTFGGYEIAMMTGAIRQAARRQMVILVDGFIATAAVLAEHAVNPAVGDYLVFTHCSAEAGHRLMLEHLKAEPLLDLNLRLGEGTGCALAYPLIDSAVRLLNEMATFEQAGVSRRDG